VERSNKLVKESRFRSVEEAVTGLPSLSNIAELIRHGQITVGVIRPMGCVAIANNAHQSLAMLVRRKENLCHSSSNDSIWLLPKPYTMKSMRTKSTTLPQHREPALRTGRVHSQCVDTTSHNHVHHRPVSIRPAVDAYKASELGSWPPAPDAHS